MSFNRTRYDYCATDAYTSRSVNEGNYRLFPGYVENKQECLKLINFLIFIILDCKK